MKKDVALTLAVVGISGCLYSSEPSIIKGDEILQEISAVQPNEKDIVFEKDLGEPTTHCYYWESTENIKK